MIERLSIYLFPLSFSREAQTMPRMKKLIQGWSSGLLQGNVDQHSTLFFDQFANLS